MSETHLGHYLGPVPQDLPECGDADMLEVGRRLDDLRSESDEV